MAGIMIEPIAATSAMATPVSPAKSVLATIVTWASPPRMWPTSTLENSTSESVMPDLFMSAPDSMNSGMAMMVKLSVPDTILRASTSR